MRPVNDCTPDGAVPSSNLELEINSDLPVRSLAARFGSFGRVQIEDFLARDCAMALRQHLELGCEWRHLFNVDEQSVEVPSDDWDSTPELNRERVSRIIDEGAAFGFQYQYDNIRAVDAPSERTRSSRLLDRFAQFMSSPTVLDLLMRVSGTDDIVYADCQATRYRAGDFLTPHNDELEGMNRRLAYVLSLTEDWQPRWGGLLHFNDGRGGIEETFPPRFNALSLFAVGQSHFVSQVASYAPVPRISVTGWLRTQAPL